MHILLSPLLLVLSAPRAQEPVPAPTPTPEAEVAPAESQADESAELAFALPIAEPRANTAAANAVLEKLHAEWARSQAYHYSSQVILEVMVGGPGSADDASDAYFRRKGSVLNGGPLGTLIEISKSVEIAQLAMDLPEEKVSVLMRANDMLIDYKSSGMQGMGGGLSGLYSVSKSELEELSASMPTPAPMNFVMMQSPSQIDPARVVEAIAAQTAFDIAEGADGEVLLTGLAAGGMLPSMDSAEADLEARLRLHADSYLPISIELGPADAPKFKLEFSNFSTSESINAEQFDWLSNGREAKELAPALRAQIEAMKKMRAGSAPVEEDEF